MKCLCKYLGKKVITPNGEATLHEIYSNGNVLVEHKKRPGYPYSEYHRESIRLPKGEQMKYPIIECKKCKHKGKLPQFISGLGSLLVCPKCGNNFYPPSRKKRAKIK